MDYIKNPNYTTTAPAALTSTQRTALKNLAKSIIDAAPADQEFISVHELVSSIRDNLPAGVTADQISGADVRAGLKLLGYKLVGK